MEARLGLLERRMVRRPHHHSHREIFPHAAIGISGPGLLAGCLQSYRAGDGSVLVPEGEVYRAGAWTPAAGGHAAAWPHVHGIWQREGAAGVAGIDGLYNLARYHDASPEGPALTLLSDRYGSRRLFIHDDGDAVVFAADFAAVLAWVGPAATLDRRFIEESVCLGAPLRGATWVEQIRLFEPATELVVTTAGARERRYWSWSQLPPSGSIRPADVVAETYERWREVLDLRLEGDHLGQQLSGGLDSRLILAEVTRRRSGWPSLTYGEPGADEVRFSARTAAVAGSPWTLLELPGPAWLDHRIAAAVENGGFIDLINAHHAGRLEQVRDVFEIDLSGFVGDVTLGDTYWGLDPQGVMNRLPYWYSPVSIPPEEAFTRISDALGDAGPWGFMMDLKLRRAINWWPHMRVNEIETRKPFVDYGFLEYCLGLPVERRHGSALHVEILRRYFPRLARVPIQRTGVRPGASRAAYYAMAAVRRAHRTARRAGVPLRPWVRGAFDLGPWLSAPGVEARFRDVLTGGGARLTGYFDPRAIRETLDLTFGTPQIAYEIAFNLYRVEVMLAELPGWMRAG